MSTKTDPVAHRRLVLEWICVLTPPGVWAVWFLVGYNIADTLACTPSAVGFLVASPGMNPVIAGITAVSAIITAATGVISLRHYRRTRAADPSTGLVDTWMWLAGIMLSALFLLIILVGFFMVIILRSPCTQSM